MDGRTLAEVMGHSVSQAQYDRFAGPFTEALQLAGCNTERRVAMYCAQVGHESGGLLWNEELATGSAYEGRLNLGNTQSGDGRRFKGRGQLQLTGRSNYGAFGRWCRSKGLVSSDDAFVINPYLVSEPRWGMLATTWYWTVSRPRLNSYADIGNVNAATYAVNGGYNGLADRTRRWNLALRLGNRLTSGGDDMTPDESAMLREVAGKVRNIEDRLCRAEVAWDGGVTDDKNNPYGLFEYVKRNNVEVRQMWLDVKSILVKLTARG